MTRVLAALVCVMTVVAGCGGGTRAPSQPLSSTWQAPTVLSYVPADTPYLLATLEQVPRGWRDQLYASFDQKYAELTKMLEEMPTAQDRSALEPWLRAALAVLSELKAKDPKRWTQELGLDEKGTFVAYGVSVWPVIRYGVADPAKVTHFAQVALAAAGQTVTRAELAGRTYWRYDDDGMTVVGALLDRELVASAFPTVIANEMLPIVLGTTKPARSLADSGSASALMERYQLLPASFGYVDVRAVANIVMGRSTGETRALDRPVTAAAGPLPPACRAEVDRLVGLVPRLVVGYRKLDATGAYFRVIAEMPPAIASEIARVRTSVPELTTGLNGHPMMSMGVAMNYESVVPLVRKVATQIENEPFECEWFTRLNDIAAEVLRVVDRPLPPALRTSRGFSFVLDDFQKDPLVVEAHATFMGPHLRDLLTMLAQYIPAFRGVTLPADGTPVPLPLAALNVPATVVAYVGANDDRMGIAVGSSAESRARDLMTAGLPKHSPLVSMAMDFPRWSALGLGDGKMPMAALRDFGMQLDIVGAGLVADMYMTFER